MKRTLVTGASGQLGCELQDLTRWKNHFIFTDITPSEGVEKLDICSREEVVQFLRDHNIERVVNCAGYTNVEGAESDAATCMNINYHGVENLASAAADCCCTMIHISTDFVFDGSRQRGKYSETSVANPISVYGESKLRGEEAMIASGCSGVIIRTAWLYSEYGNNFVKTMLRLGREKSEINVVADQIGTPTYARHLARMILHILPKIGRFRGEIFNYTNEGQCSWYEFAKEIMWQAGLDCKVNPIPTSAYPATAKRPPFSVLDKSKIKAEFGRDIPGWSAALKECLGRLM